jgi:hypothetical protein
MILFYTHKISNRLRYTLNFIFKDLYYTDFQISDNEFEFSKSNAFRISYGIDLKFADLYIPSAGLLHEIGIKEHNISIGEWHNTKTIFKITGNEIPFDIFSAVFYLLSRYEEYLPHIRDRYDRFEAESSLNYQQGFLESPVVNHWAYHLKELIIKKNSGITFKEKTYQYLSTIDIDNAYAFKQKGVMRTIGGFGRSIVNFFWEDFKERLWVLSGKMKDPYDTYEMQLELQKKYNLKVIYFVLLGDYGVNDKNLPSNNKAFQSLIKKLNDYADVGIHPSFGSNGNTNQVKKEITRLSRITHREIHLSRQHFLKLHFPETYKVLIENGIQEDFSMGYAGKIGFRAGTCSSFYWYDLDTETESNLKVHPFAVMDATLRFYMKVKPESIKELVKPLVDEVKKRNGTFISIWHNETISDWREWRGWKNAYEEVIQIATH